ncbi:MAG: glycosyltransferase family 2 protein [Candidatus Omnitrophica bacterium]|nr:glycosyltransferase family 2 protein [Candidatus Omnitrophota bacterium]
MAYPNPPELSIIIPTINRSGRINQIYKLISAELARDSYSYEIVFIDDGSNDNTAEIVRNICKSDHGVKMIKLDKNYGEHCAIYAGLKISQGKTLVIMHDDMGDNVKDINKFLQAINSGGDVVCGWRSPRYGAPLARRMISYFLNLYFSSIIGVRIHDFGCGLKAFRKEALTCGNSHLDILRQLKKYRFLEIKIKSVNLEKSRYRPLKLLRLLWNILFFPPWEKYSEALTFSIAESYNL